MNSNGSGGRLEGFFTGKGFYIVLFLCAAVIGVSAWMMAAGNQTMQSAPVMSSTDGEGHRVETIIIPARPEVGNPTNAGEEQDVETAAPPISSEGLNEAAEATFAEAESAEEAAVEDEPIFAWPVQGELERRHSMTELSYDQTMRDWRTHVGIDISVPLGETVYAAHAGTVESIVQDPMFGTTLTVDHGNGMKTVYSNLAELPAVSVGEWVERGVVIGAVGTTALCEIGQGTHLHFAIEVDGVSADPLSYLPA